MSNRRSYSSGTEKSLFQLSRGYCYAPKCLEPVTRKIDGEHIVHVEIAHIRAKAEGGARFDEKLPEERRDDFDNLLLLCTAHQKLVDGVATRKQYPVKLLLEWKEAREGDQAAQLEGLRGVTEERLQDLMSQAIGDAREGLDAALAELSATSQEAADLLRSVIDESFERPYLDLDSIASLERSALMLRSLPDDAATLANSAIHLRDLGDNAATLRQAAAYLGNLGDSASQLMQASRPLADLADNASMLNEAAKRVDSSIPWEVVNNADRLSSTLQRASKEGSIFLELPKIIRRMEELAEDLTESPPVLQVADEQRWRYFKAGVAVGVVVTIVLVALWFSAIKPV